MNFCNHSSDFHYISLHHMHLLDVIGTSSCVSKNPALFGVYRYLYLGNRLTLHQCTEINRLVCKIPAFRSKNDRSFSVPRSKD